MEELVVQSATVSIVIGFLTTYWREGAAGSFSEEGTLDGLAYMDGDCFSNWAVALRSSLIRCSHHPENLATVSLSDLSRKTASDAHIKSRLRFRFLFLFFFNHKVFKPR